MSRCILKTQLIFLMFAFVHPASVLAHKVNIFAYVEGETVYSESYFPDGRPVDGGKVRIYDSTERLLLEGQTGKAGLYNFPLPKASPLTLEIDAGMGHKNRFQLKKTASQE